MPSDLVESELALLDLPALEAVARERLDPRVYDYYRTGARDEWTLHANRRAWESLPLLPRVLAGIDEVRMETTVLGARLRAPILVAPMAAQRMAHAGAETAVAHAAARLGIGMALSTSSTTPVEELARIPGLAALWFQLYAFQDRGVTEALIRRAVAAGAAAIVLTVDNAVEVATHRWPAGGFTTPEGIILAHHVETELLETRLDWAYAAWVAEVAAPCPLVLKGVLHPADARAAVDAGIRAIVVSNHGGRCLDGSLPTALALPAVVRAVDGRAEILVDGGIARGGHVLRALALGARAVLVGRPVLWGLAAAGAVGAEHVLARIIEELRVDAALAGVPSLDRVPRDLVVGPPAQV